MISSDFEGSTTTLKSQETASVSRTTDRTITTTTTTIAASVTTNVTPESTNCPTQQPVTRELPLANTKDTNKIISPPELTVDLRQTSSTNSFQQNNRSETVKVFAPVIAHDVTLPDNTGQKVPMVMVPVPDSRTLMAIPISTLSQFKESQMATNNNHTNMNDEQQARDLLAWNDGIGTLDGCDLRFRINQLGCLELLDSDDESENRHNVPKHHNVATISSRRSQNQNYNQSNNSSNRNRTNGVSGTSSRLTQQQIAPTIERNTKKQKVDANESLPIRQISPGSSLLKDGPNLRRPRSATGNNSNINNNNNNSSSGSSTSSTSSSNSSSSSMGGNITPTTPTNNNLVVNTSGSRPPSVGNNSLSLLRKVEHSQLLLEKLIPKQRLEEIRSNGVEQWTVEDVGRFIDSIPGCSGYGKMFELQQICGKALMYLDQKDLLDVINVKLGPAVKIHHAISLLK